MKKRMTEYTHYLKATTFVIVFFTFSIINNSYATNSDSTNVVSSTEEDFNKLTVENVKIALEEEGVKHADIVLRQAILETGWFKCTSCSLSKNNIFGFWYKKKYIEFEDWRECISYYKRWQDRHYQGGDYYEFLKRVGFATNTAYVQRLKSIKGI